MTDTFETRVEVYFRTRLGWSDATLRDAKRLTGGISRETWKVTFERQQPGAEARSQALVLRIDPVSSLLESNRTVEFGILRALEDTPGVPVPQAVCNEDDPSHLGGSFMALAALPGIADIGAILRPPYSIVGRSLARAHFTTLGTLSRLDIRQRRLDELMNAPTVERAALDAVARWEGVLRAHSLGPIPITEAALRHLKRDPPTAARISLIHGDYRLGNCLYMPDGTISGILDWEMAHLGDPLEDLAWAMSTNWRPTAARHLVAGHLTEDEAIEAWEETSLQKVDPAALRWWRLFTCVKCAALWTTAGHSFLHGGSNVVHALPGWLGTNAEEMQMLEWMGV